MARSDALPSSPAVAISDVAPFLRCPLCGQSLVFDGGGLRCPAGHAFDVSRHGHVTLLPRGGRPPRGDSAEMVAARAAFLGAGHFEAIARAVGEEARSGAGECVVEVGAGTGYYLARALIGRPGIALDSSRAALRVAAKADARIGAVVCDAWRPLPVRDGVAAAALCVFAPRDAGELRRILAANGVLVVVTPTPRHLAELVAPLGLVRVDQRKPERLARAFGEPLRERLVEERLRLSRDDVRALVAMGPSAHHVDAAAVARPAETTLSVRVAVYGPRPSNGAW
jgi:23S rRNA (guanine745-N1)-methyltransferase